MDRRLFLLTALGLVGTAGCTSVPPLANAHESADALATALLDALARADRTSLENLAVTEREFRDHVWPDLPAARPERNLPFSYVWGDLHQKSSLRLSETLERHGGKRYRLRSTRFGGETRYAHYLVHRNSTLDVVEPSGAAISLEVCGSFLEKDGVWKVFSYVVDD